jgi:dGTP triphosphohydrolase
LERRKEFIVVANTQAFRLVGDLERLDADMAPTPEWSSRFAQCCRDRDALESVRSTLAAADASLDIDTALIAVDRAAQHLLDRLPFTSTVRDRQLAAVRSRSLAAWWVRWAVAPASA